MLDFDTWRTESDTFLDGAGAEIRARGFREAEPFARGVNSIQLVRQDGRWWVVTILWDVERPDQPIPPPYLPSDPR